MSENNHVRTRSLPWVVAAVLAAVAAALAVLLVVVTNSAAKASAGSDFAPTRDQQAAVAAATTETVNLLTYSRKSFNADYARALAGTTGSLKSDLTKMKSSTLAQLNAGKFDLKGSVSRAAFESQDEKGAVLVLVTAGGSNIVDGGGASAVATTQRLELTMTKVGGKWLASNLTSVGIGG